MEDGRGRIRSVGVERLDLAAQPGRHVRARQPSHSVDSGKKRSRSGQPLRRRHETMKTRPGYASFPARSLGQRPIDRDQTLPNLRQGVPRSGSYKFVVRRDCALEATCTQGFSAGEIAMGMRTIKLSAFFIMVVGCGLFMLTPKSAADGRVTLDQRLEAALARQGFTGSVASTLERRIGHRIDNQLADLGRLLFFDTVTGL